MRDYLYLWHQPQAKRLVASGIEFRDVVPELAGAGGVVLLRHKFSDVAFDVRSRFEFVPPERLAALAGDHPYDYGDFVWADFGRAVELGELPEESVAELTYFAHAARPLRGVEVPGLANRFLYWSHDDGWYAQIFYSHWPILAALLRRLLPAVLDERRALQTLESLSSREVAFWCRRGAAFECERSLDIDALQREHLTDL
jgi:hypothetical protein